MYKEEKKFFKETITDLSELLYFRAKLGYNLMLYKLHIRVAQNFKHEKFIWDQADSYSLRKRNAENVKIIEFRPLLDIAIERQSQTT